jgi:hypothetical protein
MTRLLLALDRATVRRIDVDGHLHVERANISKANVCGYFGREIPDWQTLGLDANRTYMLLRDPDELAKAAASFAGKPLLDEHIPVSADDHPEYAAVGSIGTDVQFDGTYLTAPLSIWKGASIRRIESGVQRELSPGYRYRADMTPGNFNGVAYDGKMCDIICNHLALVREGRTGPDVIIGDARLEMPKMLKSRKALMVSGAIAALVRPRMAQDAKLDLDPALDDVTAANLVDQRDAVADLVVEIVTPGLAADQKVTREEVLMALDAVAGTAPDDDDALPTVTPAPKPTPAPAPKPVATGVSQQAMDAAIAESAANARRDALAESAAIRNAEREVQPIVGEIAAMDSAAAVYKLGLTTLKVDFSGVPETGYGALFRAVSGARAVATPTPIAVDYAAMSASSAAFAERFPNRTVLKRV